LPAVDSTETFGSSFTICLKSFGWVCSSFSPETTSMEIGTSCSFSARFWAVTTTSPSVAGVASAAMAAPAQAQASKVLVKSIRRFIVSSPSLVVPRFQGVLPADAMSDGQFC